MSATTASGNCAAISQHKGSAEAASLLRATLSTTLLGERTAMDLYARNGFRYLSVPAWVDRDVLAVKCQAFRNLARVNLARARAASIHTVLDEHLDADATQLAVARLESPRHRFFAELFWPHVPDADFARIRDAGRLGMEALISGFDPRKKSGVVRSQFLHVQALVYHCLAIEAELDYLGKTRQSPGIYWEKAIGAWREVWAEEEFWSYMHARMAKLDDPRLKNEDVEKVRQELPRIILGFNELFAERYAEGEEFVDCMRHLNLIRHSGFPDPLVREATLGAVKQIAGTKLEDLDQRAKQAFAGIASTVGRHQFETIAGPLLKEALEIRKLLAERLALPAEFLQQPAFNDLARAVKQATVQKISYEDNERERNILYSSLYVKRLLSLPLSPLVRRDLEMSTQSDNRILYSRFGMDSGFPQATECFFLPGAESDPDESIVIAMHRIKERKVEADRVRGTAGINVRFDRGRMLIPRSKMAKQRHGSTVTLETQPSEYTPEQRVAAERLKELEINLSASRSEMASEREKKLKELKGPLLAELHAKGLTSRTAKANVAIGELDAAEKGAVRAEDAALESAKRKINANFVAELNTKRKQSESKLVMLKGRAGLFRAELPAGIFVFLAMAALLVWSASSSFDPSGIVWPTVIRTVLGIPLGVLVLGKDFWGFIEGKPVRKVRATIILVVVLLLFTIGAAGMIVGSLLIGRMIRMLLKRRMLSPLKMVEKEEAKEIFAAELESEANTKKIRAEFAPKRKEQQDSLNRIAEERQEIEAAHEKKIAPVRKLWDDKISAADQDFQKQANLLKSKLVRTATVLKQAQQSDFPAYMVARSKGWVNGEKPTGTDMEMTPSERARALALLRG